MPEEEEDDQLADEMLRMMQEEVGEGDEGSGDADAEAASAEGDASEADSEADMLAAMMQEAGSGEEGGAVFAAAPQASLASGDALSPNARRMQDVKLSVTIELGHTVQPISTLLDWTEGSLIELDKLAGDAVDVLVNGRPFAKGEVVTVAENFGVRITEIGPVQPRPPR